MTDRIPASDYAQLLLSDTPMIDLRAPIEFTKGAFPGSVSLPLMSDSERAAIGTCYKQQGQQAAIDLGHQLVSGAVKQARIDAWLAQIQRQPDTVLYCFRGGMRSQITQQWLREAGVNRPYVEGGYKAMRSYLIAQTDRLTQTADMVIVGGMTGCGKTDFLTPRADSVDLEGLANHRGSSFGRQLTEQPSQINFENTLALALMRHQARGATQLILEDESRLIGRCSLPLEMHERMAQAPRVILEISTEARIEQILKDYVTDMQAAFIARDGLEAGHQAFSEHLLASLSRVKKRLGPVRYQALNDIMVKALQLQLSRGALDGHRDWIAQLLTEYYDPMYHYQLEKKPTKPLFQGPPAAVAEFLDQRL
ncbi:tRNA 2-selenouridine(34) synthase MnmH [Ferrimonas pelagia]|uniref:tRNA 2-selenouridine synthase n=1 Tax=Ferrimonas pelagia TaxID=1177826 RepID=A0ABP9F261_9GAMM